MKKSNKYFKAGSLYLLGNIFNKGIAFLMIPIYTRILTTYDYGIINTYISWVAIISMILGMSLHMGIRAAFVDYEEKIDEFNSSITLLSVFSSILIAAVTITIVITFEVNIEIKLLILCLVQGFATAIISNYSMYLMMKLNYKCKTLLQVVPNLTINIISIILIVFVYESNKYMGKILPSSLITLFVALLIISIIIKKSPIRINLAYWTYALKISMPIILHGLSLSILSQSDRIMITSFVGAAETGVYSLIYNFSMIARVVGVSLDGVWVPWFTKSMNNRDTNTINDRVKVYLAIMTYTIIGIMFVSPEVLIIMAPPEYWHGKTLIPLIVMSSYVIFLYTIYVNVEHYHKKTGYIAFNTIIAAVINIFLNLIFIPRFGMYAAAVTTLFSYIISLGIHYRYSRKMESDLFPFKIVLKHLVFIIFVVIVYYITLNNEMIRWGLLIVVTFVIAIKYKEDLGVFLERVK